MGNIYKTYFKSDIGLIEICGNEEKILTLNFADETDCVSTKNGLPEFMIECLNQLEEYFKGERRDFELEVKTEGTDFQRTVWDELKKIPYGQTMSYKEIAVRSGREKAVRAVGNANNRNKIAIIIPCHRVIGSNKKLTGYAGGLWRKEWLLNHEKSMTVKK